MDEQDWLVLRFEENRAHLRAVAYRMLGSTGEADDAVQETWLRLARSDAARVENLRGWLTTVVSRVCLDALRSRASSREVPLEESQSWHEDAMGPEQEALLADAVGPALLTVLDTLSPAERLAFVLHDTFGVPFAEIAPIVGRSPDAAKMLASRARRRVRGAHMATAAPDPATDSDPARRREVVDAFLAAARDGDFDVLLTVLDPEVVLRADRAAVDAAASRVARGAPGAPTLSPEVRGASAVAEVFFGRAKAARPALVDGTAGAVWAPGGRPRVVFGFTITREKIVSIDLIADPEQLLRLDLTLLDG